MHFGALCFAETEGLVDQCENPGDNGAKQGGEQNAGQFAKAEDEKDVVGQVKYEEDEEQVDCKLLIGSVLDAGSFDSLFIVAENDFVEPYSTQKSNQSAAECMESGHVAADIDAHARCKGDDHHGNASSVGGQHSDEEDIQARVDISPQVDIVKYQHLQ